MNSVLKRSYVEWHKLARDILNDEVLIPERTEEQICELVSLENWLIFTPKGMDKNDLINGENPNIWFSISNIESEDFTKAVLGLTFNNLSSYEKFKTIMHGYNESIKSQVIEKLLKLGDGWKLNVKRKIKDHNHSEAPKYILTKEWKSKEIDNSIIDEIITNANVIRENGIDIRDERRLKNQYYCETPSINLMEASFELNAVNFKNKILEVFEILALCLDVKTITNIKKIEKEEKNNLLLIKNLKQRILMFEKGLDQENNEGDYLGWKSRLEQLGREE